METRTMVVTVWIGTASVLGIPVQVNRVCRVDGMDTERAGFSPNELRPTMDAEFEVIADSNDDA